MRKQLLKGLSQLIPALLPEKFTMEDISKLEKEENIRAHIILEALLENTDARARLKEIFPRSVENLEQEIETIKTTPSLTQREKGKLMEEAGLKQIEKELEAPKKLQKSPNKPLNVPSPPKGPGTLRKWSQRLYRVAKILQKCAAFQIQIHLDKYSKQILEELKNLQDYINLRQEENPERYPDPFTDQEMLNEFNRLFQQTEKGLKKIKEKIQQAISKIPNFSSQVIIKPHFSPEDYYKPIEDANISLLNESEADFTFFSEGPEKIEDILEANDPDFFANAPNLQADYFRLIQQLRNEGKPNRILTLYTARPEEDRVFYSSSSVVPSGIFLTTDLDRAIGLASDLSGKTGRDIYQVKIDSEYLIKTLDTGTIQDYQVVGEGNIPVKSMVLL